MRRRALLALASATIAWPLRVAAQKVYRLGTLQFSRTPLLREHMRVLRERLRQLGFAEGRNLQIIEQYSSFDAAIRQQSADRLMDAKPDLLLAFGSTNARLLQTASAGEIPVVFTIVGDPVAYGIVKDLARPGRNTTGVASLQQEIAAKRLELVREVLPKARRVVLAAYLNDVTYIASEPLLRQTAAKLGFELIPALLSVSAPDAAMQAAIQGGADAVFVYQPMSFITGFEAPEKIVQLAMARRIPVFFAESELVERGGLLSYGPNFLDETRRAADLVAKVLKGANAGNLPIDQSTRFELVVNLKTANALGIEIPQSVRTRIDRIVK